MANDQPGSARPDLSRMDWENLYPRLLIATAGRLRRMTWRGQRSGSVPGAPSAHDFVQQAVASAASGERSWNPQLSAFENFWKIISSQISNVASSAENRSTTLEEESTTDVRDIRDYRESPEEKLSYKTEVEHLLSFLKERDKDAERMARLIIEQGIESPQELSVALGESTAYINNLKKRLRRLAASYKEHQHATGGHSYPNKPARRASTRA